MGGAPKRVVVVGGGISGLVAAYRLIQTSNGTPIDVTVVEASRSPGGKLRTSEVAGIPIEEGADSFVVRKPWAIDLCRELGLGEELVAPAPGRAYVWARGGLQRYPEPSAFGVPASVEELLRWPGLSRRGRVRAAADLFRPRRKDEGVGRRGPGWAVRAGAGTLQSDAVVLATPAFESSRLLREATPEAAAELAGIPYASTAVVLLVYPPGTAERLPSGSGFIVPPAATDSGGPGPSAITASTWVSSKWPREEHAGRAVIRCYAGRFGDDEA